MVQKYMRQRIISVFVQTYAYSRCFRGESKSHTIKSWVSQVMLGHGEWQWTPRTSLRLSTASKCLPAGWPMFVFEMAGPASIVGGSPEELSPCDVTHHSDGTGPCRRHGTSYGYTVTSQPSIYTEWTSSSREIPLRRPSRTLAKNLFPAACCKLGQSLNAAKRPTDAVAAPFVGSDLCC